MATVAILLNWLDRFIQYLWAVVKHIVLLLSGAFFTLAPLIGPHIFKTPTVQTDMQIFLDSYSQPIGLFLLFLATFGAWSEQRERLAAFEKEPKPSLAFVVPSMAFSPAQYGRVHIRIDLLILNSGEQTSLHSWQASVLLRSGKTMGLANNPSLFDQTDKEFMGKPNLILDDEVIVKGGKRTGWIRFAVTDVSPLEPTDIRMVSLACYDSFGQFHEINGNDFGPDKPTVPPSSHIES